MSDPGANPLFVDTGAFYARADEDDTHHGTATEVFDRIRTGALPYRPLYTTQAVLSELATLCLYRLGHERAVAALRAVRASESFNVLPVDRSTFSAAAGQFAATLVPPGTSLAWPLVVFLATSGALLAALLRVVLFERDDPLVMVSVGLLLWLFFDLQVVVSVTGIAVALTVTVVLGVVSYVLETASLPGMLTGVLLGLLTIVLGGTGWFVVLMTFFGVGGLAAKFRYGEKQERGIAEENEGARGSGNVLANSLAGLAAVLGAAASPTMTALPRVLFLFAFAGSVAAATSDTLSSEIGGVFDGPRLITTFERVEPGTDGAVTWQGELAGVAGAALIAAITFAVFESVTPVGAGVVFAAGFLGMTVDSLLGATVEGRLLENEGVNFAATLAGALAAGAFALVANAASLTP